MAKYMKSLDYKAPVSPFMISGQSCRALHQAFLARGHALAAQFRDLLKLCESHILTDDKQEGERRSCKIDYDTGLKIIYALFRSSPGCQAREALIRDIKRWRQDIGPGPYGAFAEILDKLTMMLRSFVPRQVPDDTSLLLYRY